MTKVFDKMKNVLRKFRRKLHNRAIARKYKICNFTPDPKNTELWHDYYKEAEGKAWAQFNKYLKPMLDARPEISFDSVLDFACGFGRMANILKYRAETITCCDINSLAIEHCKERFSSDGACKFSYCACDGSLSLPFDDKSFSFIFSWDAMVHFKYKWLDYYMHEFGRIIRDGGHVLIHHSNYGNTAVDAEKSENYCDNPHYRTNVAAEDIAFIAKKHDFAVIAQNVIDWGNAPKLDCISLLRKGGNK